LAAKFAKHYHCAAALFWQAPKICTDLDLRDFILRCQPRQFENVTLVARWREHFLGGFGDFFDAKLLQKEEL